MKPQDLKDLYPASPDYHHTLCRALNNLDDTAPQRYKKHRRIHRMIAALAIIAALAAFTATAYATDLFGLRAERVGKYGLNMTVIEDSPLSSKKKHVKPIIGYIPDGCKLVDESEGSGKYWYTTDGKDYGAEISVAFYLTDASDYSEEGRYVVSSSELTIKGHKAIIGVQQLEEGGEKSYFGVEYFENWGYVAHYSGNNYFELLKFMAGIDLEEDVDYTEPPTTPDDDPYHVPEDDYAFMMREDYRFVEVGEPFGYSEWIYNEDGEQKPEAFTVTVRSVEERYSYDGLDKDGFLYGERFSEWFDEDNKLITPYTRQDYDFGDGDGLNELITHTDTLTERHFMVVTVDVTANADTETDGTPLTAWASPIIREDGDSYDFPTGYGKAFLMYQSFGSQLSIDWKKGDTRTYVFGILVDDEVLDQSCIEFMTKRYEIDHRAETVENINETICVMLRGGGAK